jgi:hypothetical protein
MEPAAARGALLAVTTVLDEGLAVVVALPVTTLVRVLTEPEPDEPEPEPEPEPVAVLELLGTETVPE